MNGKKAKGLRKLLGYEKPEVTKYAEVKGTDRLRRFHTGGTDTNGNPVMGLHKTVTLSVQDTHRQLYRWLKGQRS